MSLNPVYRGGLLLMLLLLASPAWSANDQLEQATACGAKTSRLERLHCYDALFRAPAQDHPGDAQRPPSWYTVKTLEQDRGDDFTFRSEHQGNGDIVMSAPALGTTAPRPRLVISCDDTITRFQLHIDTPLAEGRTHLTLTTEQDALEQTWRIRDSGYLISGGRGLPAIATLRRLLDGHMLTLGSDSAALDGLRFDLTDLRARIQPLREACRW